MPQSRLVFLTGATGFIGSRLARLLASRGDRLRCLVRAGSRTAELEAIGAELVRGDIADADTLARAMEGANLAYHLAAIYDVGVVDAAAMERANVGGTRAFLSAVERAGVPRAVYASSTAALAPVEAGEGDETSELPPGARSPTVYHRTKAEAHRLAREAQRQGLPLVVICPAYGYGPGDPGPGGRFIADLLAGRVPGLLTRAAWFSYVHGDDIAEGMLLAGERGEPGEVYVLSGEHASVDDFAARVCALAGCRMPRLRFPVPLARATGILLDGLTRLTGVRFPISRESVDLAAGSRWLHSHRKATEAWGWTPRPLAEGLPGTVQWFRTRSER